jgi:hypothetical protein
MKENKSIRPYIYMILAGIVIVSLTANIQTGISYGFIIGNNEGLGVYAKTQMIATFIGTELSVDVLFDPIGYLLIAGGLVLLAGSGIDREKPRKRGIIMSIIGMAANILELFLPFAVKQDKLVIPVIILYCIQILAVVSIMYSVIIMCTVKIDNYKFMQVGRDLRFGADLYGVCMVTEKVLDIFGRAGIYFANILSWIVWGFMIFAVIYFVVKFWIYMRATDTFGTDSPEAEGQKK